MKEAENGHGKGKIRPFQVSDRTESGRSEVTQNFQIKLTILPDLQQEQFFHTQQNVLRVI
jgi:hypothetical protein